MAGTGNLNHASEQSFFHEMDARFKLVSMILFNIAVLNGNFHALALSTLIMFWVFIRIRLQAEAILPTAKYLCIPLIIIIGARAFSTPGYPLLPSSIITATHEGIREGTLIAWRLIVIMLSGLVLVATSRPADIKRAVEWFFRPVPFIPEHRIGDMISLILRFLPMIFRQASEIRAAQNARCIGVRKNPLYRLSAFTMVLLRKLFVQADDLALAMTARGYTDRPGRLDFSSTGKDWAALLITVCICIVIY